MTLQSHVKGISHRGHRRVRLPDKRGHREAASERCSRLLGPLAVVRGRAYLRSMPYYGKNSGLYQVATHTLAPQSGPMKQGNTSSFLEAHSSIAGMPPLVLGLNIDTSRLMKAFETPDDVGAIIRIHKDLDRELKRIASVMVLKSDRRNVHSVSQRIECLKVAGLSEKRLAASKEINLVRNAFAHGDKESFDEQDIDRLLQAIRLVLSPDFTPGAFHDLTTDPYGGWDYSSLDCKGRFCQLCFTALALVASIENEFEKHSFKPKFPRLLVGIKQMQKATKGHTLLVFLYNR